MNYFITGGTGFIGNFLIEKLLARDGCLYLLVRASSVEKIERLKTQYPQHADRIIAVIGDIQQPRLGVDEAQISTLRGSIDHFFHLAAVYDLKADAQSQELANIDGTRNALDLAKALQAKCFQHASSIAAAGFYNGIFREDMFDEAPKHDHPYFRTKQISEGIVRAQSDIPWRIYRPGVVIGHSQTGEMGKIDGPYYYFKQIQKLRRILPQWMPVIGFEGGQLNMVPVDFVAAALDHIAHKEGFDNKCFHLTDPNPHTVGEALNIFADAAHAPRMAVRVDSRAFAFIPPVVKTTLKNLPPVRRIVTAMLDEQGIPADTLQFINMPTRYDNREAERALADSGIEVPPLESYATKIWDYWERNLDPDLYMDRSLRGNVEGKTILITGASSGIGHQVALLLGSAGAKVLLVARNQEKLADTQSQIQEAGGWAQCYSADLADMEDCDRLVKEVLDDHQNIDVLINNAGRSIRRSIELSFDRFHDFERTMQLNYFGALRLILGFAPTMLQRKQGHIINISSIAVIIGSSPRFTAYSASKAALDAFSRGAAAEFSDRNVAFTTINMPLVRTPMIGPTSFYDSVPTLSPEEAAEMVAEAIIKRPKRIATPLGIGMQLLNAILPKATEILMNMVFKLFPDSAAAKGIKEEAKPEITSEQIALAALLKGLHL